jgi:prepilin-type processing-associated H-X9-DG protein
MPLAGLLRIDVTAMSQGAIRDGVNDRQQKRYTYAHTTGSAVAIITPLPAAVAPYLGTRNLAYEDWNKLDQQLNNTLGIWKMFMCPMTESFARHRQNANPFDSTPVGQGTMLVVSVGNSMTHFWSTNSDYAMNEGVFGFDYHSGYAARRLAGNLTRVSRPAETMLFCDANNGPSVDPLFPPSFRYPWITMTPTLDQTTAPGPVTLADVLEQNWKVVPNRAVIDRPRHRGRINVVFADGHVESMAIDPGTLARVLVSAR